MSDRIEVFLKQFIDRGGWKKVLSGLGVTFEVAVAGLIIGIIIGTVIATVKLIPKYKLAPKIFSKICDIYIGFFRGTPLVVQLLIAYFVLLPLLSITVKNKVIVAAVIYGMNSGAYVAEIMRSGIQAVDPGQLEAARAVGLSYWTSMLKIVIPQGIKNILPTLGNEFITLIKDTSVVGYIACEDLTKALKNIGATTYDYIIPYLLLAAIYLVIVYGISCIVKLIERRLGKVDRHN